jgi:hypothetical protein
VTRRIVIWILIAALAAAVLFAIVRGYEAWRARVFSEGDTAGAQRVQILWDEDRAAALAQANEDARRNAKETERRLKAQQENDRAQEALLATARRDAAAAAAAADGLRLRASAYLDAAGCSSLAGDPAVECVRQAAAAIGDALGRGAEIARRVAADADEARARGLKCEADYDALTPDSTPRP